MRRVCAVMMVAATSSPAVADPDSTANRMGFIARHRCAVVARLAAMHRRGPGEEAPNRFIILRLRGEPQRYVQCMFEDLRDSRMICEASSGAYGPTGQGQLRLGASERAALRALGYVQAAARENFARPVELGDPPDLTIAADLMLAALYDGYGARPGRVIELWSSYGDAPVVPCGTPTS